MPDKEETYPSIEAAAEVLESFGIPSDEIDVALIELTIFERNLAGFGPEGRFVFSDRIDL